MTKTKRQWAYAVLTLVLLAVLFALHGSSADAWDPSVHGWVHVLFGTFGDWVAR